MATVPTDTCFAIIFLSGLLCRVRVCRHVGSICMAPACPNAKVVKKTKCRTKKEKTFNPNRGGAK